MPIWTFMLGPLFLAQGWYDHTLFIQDIHAYFLWKQIKSSKPNEQLFLEKTNTVKFCSHSNVFKNLKNTLELVIKLSNSIEHSIIVMSNWNQYTTIFPSGDSAMLKEVSSKYTTTTFFNSILHGLDTNNRILITDTERVFSKIMSVSNCSRFRKYIYILYMFTLFKKCWKFQKMFRF